MIEGMEEIYLDLKEGKVEETIRKLDGYVIAKALALLKAYDITGDFQYYKRAVNFLEEKGEKNSFLRNISLCLENTGEPKKMCRALTSTNIREGIEISKRIDDAYGKFITYVLNRVVGENGEAMEYLKRACDENIFEEELAKFMMVYAFGGESREVIKNESKDFEEFMEILRRESKEVRFLNKIEE